MNLPYAEPYKIKMVEPIRTSTHREREQWIREAGYNLFRLRADQVFIDVLTDSGTGAMSDRQWSAMMVGDESYAGASSFFNLKNAVKNITGFDYCLPTHQGRAAENVLFSALIKEGDYIPGNSHFDTTKGHIEYRRAHAVDCTIDEAMDTQLEIPFKGNVCPVKLEQALAACHQRIPFIIVTITNNTAGGQPVSMANLREVRRIADTYGKPVIIDAARFAENAYFIKTREKGYADKSIKEIVREMFSYADGMTMSAKKDAIVNMGGFIATRRQDWYEQACTFNIMFEGYITYGGLSGRDMNALAIGLDENTEFEVLHARMSQVAYLAYLLDEYGIPYQRPVGGHAIFIDARKVLPNIPREEFAAQTLAIELYLEGGVRGCEIGYILADRDPVTRENRTGGLDLLRLAIPRRTYTDNHMAVIAAALKNVYDRRHKITSGVRIVREAPIMRHFTVELEPLPGKHTVLVDGGRECELHEPATEAALELA
jgi:tryptophanase